MLSCLATYTLLGIEARPVEVEVDISPGALPKTILVGLAEAAVDECKTVVLDFWASWCKPCRMENPNVVAAYRQFKDKNFTILGVSLDRPDGREDWMKAIAQDKLEWTHVSDLKFWESAVVPMYNIQGIPYNVLLDPQGKVVAENLRGGDLAKKLNEVLK